ncbi:MAG: hypothetical protein P8165_18955 [Deltaproteobacteria bacterium]|jgi:hypothetical protein
MIAIKRTAIVVIALGFMWGASLCFADSSIPNLVGTWAVEEQGAVLVKGETSGAKTHHSGDFSTLTAEAVVTKQQGRVLHGVFKSPRSSEKFIAAISMDNKKFYLADDDGFLEGEIVDNDRINVVYRHVTGADTVIGVGTWMRKK